MLDVVRSQSVYWQACPVDNAQPTTFKGPKPCLFTDPGAPPARTIRPPGPNTVSVPLFAPPAPKRCVCPQIRPSMRPFGHPVES